MRFIIFCGVSLLALVLLSGCIRNQRLVEVDNDELRPIVWEYDKSSIRLTGRIYFSRHSYHYSRNKAGLIQLKIRVRNPNEILEFVSEEIQIFVWGKEKDKKMEVLIEESTIDNSDLKSSRRSTFEVTGVVTGESFYALTRYDEFIVELPDVIINQDTITLEPVRLYHSHWLSRVFPERKNDGKED